MGWVLLVQVVPIGNAARARNGTFLEILSGRADYGNGLSRLCLAGILKLPVHRGRPERRATVTTVTLNLFSAQKEQRSAKISHHFTRKTAGHPLDPVGIDLRDAIGPSDHRTLCLVRKPRDHELLSQLLRPLTQEV